MADIAAQVSASLDALTREFDVIAHNLANVSTVGYKRRCSAFSEALGGQATSGTEGSGEESSSGVFDFSQGHLIQTDRVLDCALHGKGFFVVETPEGPLYTRHGVFETNATGQVVDLSGRIVGGTAGPLVVPANVGLSRVHVSQDGRVSADNAAIGQFQVVEFPDKEDQLVPAGENCFWAPEDVDPVDVENPVVKQGFREASNVRLIDELVNMIMVSRMYEANMRLVNVTKDATNSLIGAASG
ncbi:MAG: flagellar hook basal-body protein [Sedimentisphaerales bacterium]|nr:flagellar hook basal-body protein [Sedimentisphaerales bacterium]